MSLPIDWILQTAANILADAGAQVSASSETPSWKFDAVGFTPDEIKAIYADPELKDEATTIVNERMGELATLKNSGGRQRWISGEYT